MTGKIRYIQIESKPLINKDKHRIIIHLITHDKVIDNLTFDITREQEPKLFDSEYEKKFYFLQSVDGQNIISSVEYQLKQLINERYSVIHKEDIHHAYIQLTLDIENDTMNSVEQMFYTYCDHKLATYLREECMRIAIEYGFDDILDELDCNELQLINENQIPMMINDVKRRLRLQTQRRLVGIEIGDYFFIYIIL